MGYEDIKTASASDGMPTMEPEQMWRVVEAAITVVVAHTPGPSDAVNVMLESLVALCVAFDVPLQSASALMMGLAEDHAKVPGLSAELRTDAKALVQACWKKAQDIRARTPDIKRVLEELKGKRDGVAVNLGPAPVPPCWKKERATCATCGRLESEHGSLLDMVCTTGFKPWGAGGNQ